MCFIYAVLNCVDLTLLKWLVSNYINKKILNYMTLQETQSNVDNWIKTTGVRYFSELTNTVLLMEEVGEVARIMSRKYGEQSFKESDKKKT